MRISDWSSDVCSSDLIELDLQVTDKPVDLVANNIDLAIRFGSLPDRRLVARRLLSNRRYLCASPKYLKKHGEPESLADLAHHRRSEEHTSELQSLMRISYAVFCLKKKTKTNKHNNSQSTRIK